MVYELLPNGRTAGHRQEDEPGAVCVVGLGDVADPYRAVTVLRDLPPLVCRSQVVLGDSRILSWAASRQGGSTCWWPRSTTMTPLGLARTPWIITCTPLCAPASSASTRRSRASHGTGWRCGTSTSTSRCIADPRVGLHRVRAGHPMQDRPLAAPHRVAHLAGRQVARRRSAMTGHCRTRLTIRGRAHIMGEWRCGIDERGSVQYSPRKRYTPVRLAGISGPSPDDPLDWRTLIAFLDVRAGLSGSLRPPSRTSCSARTWNLSPASRRFPLSAAPCRRRNMGRCRCLDHEAACCQDDAQTGLGDGG